MMFKKNTYYMLMIALILLISATGVDAKRSYNRKTSNSKIGRNTNNSYKNTHSNSHKSEQPKSSSVLAQIHSNNKETHNLTLSHPSPVHKSPTHENLLQPQSMQMQHTQPTPSNVAQPSVETENHLTYAYDRRQKPLHKHQQQHNTTAVPTPNPVKTPQPDPQNFSHTFEIEQTEQNSQKTNITGYSTKSLAPIHLPSSGYIGVLAISCLLLWYFKKCSV